MNKTAQIKEVLRRDLKLGARVTESQLTEAAEAVVLLPSVNESDLKKIGETVFRDSTTFICASTDMSDINNLLGKTEKK